MVMATPLFIHIGFCDLLAIKKIMFPRYQERGMVKCYSWFYHQPRQRTQMETVSGGSDQNTR